MFTALAIASLTAAYLILGKLGISRLERERSSLKLPRLLPLISIIIPAYQSSGTIAKTLESARKADYPHKEIIVINDSQDNTPSIARSYGARVIQNKKRLGKPAALNRATREARGEILFFLDADTTISRTCLKRLIPWFSLKEVAAVMPKYLLRDGNPLSRLASFENLFTFALLRVHMFFGSMAGFRGCSVAIRKGVLEKNPWPDTLLEDNHLSATLAGQGHRIIWEPRAISYTQEPGTFGETSKQKRRWGEGAALAFAHHRRFYITSPQFITFLIPYFALGIASTLLFLSLLASTILFPTLTFPLLIELVMFFIAMYIHTLLFLYLGGREWYPLSTLRFMLIYFPVMLHSYSRGVLSGIKRKKVKKKELHFRDW